MIMIAFKTPGKELITKTSDGGSGDDVGDGGAGGTSSSSSTSY